MLRARRLALLLALLALAAPPAAGDRSSTGPEPYRVSDFDTGSLALIQQCKGGSVACVADDTGPGQHLRFSVTGDREVSWITIGRMPRDVRPFRTVRFRARVRGAPASGLALRLRSKKGRLSFRLPELGGAWTAVRLALPAGELEDDFDPTDVRNIRIVTSSRAGFELDLDDLTLHAGGDGWRHSPRELAAWGIDPAAPVFRVADLEDPEHGGTFRADAGTARREDEGRATRTLVWTAPAGADAAVLALTRVPRDLRAYAAVRFRIRASGTIRDGLSVRLRAGSATLERSVEGVSRRWRTRSVPIPGMLVQGEFDPEALTELQLVYRGDRPLELHLDDVELVKGPGGWETTEEQQVATVFGAKRASKVRRVETDHFVVFTDSAAARRKFPRALEKAHAFVMETLGLRDPGGRLSVYVFQNAALYHGFCVRKGRARADAERSAGHASGTYFATYYQAPDAPTVVHELTHALFGQAVGRGGGSWLQEGVAVMVEERWQDRSAAVLFAPRLRSGARVPLAELMRVPVLIRSDDASGGPRTGTALYAQAGAFAEFLLRGPHAERVRKALPALAALDGGADDHPARVAETLGVPLDRLERDWIAWGAHPGD